MSLVVGLAIVVLLVAANGFFVAVEFALVAVDRARLETLAAEGSVSAKAALNARRRLSFHLSGAQLGITVTSLVIGFLAQSTIAELLTPITDRVAFLSGSTASIVFALAVATVFQMVFGELIPKTIAVAKPEPTARLLSPIAIVVHGSLGLLIRSLNGVANATVRLFGVEPQEELEDVRTLEELSYIIQSSGESGALEPEAQTLLARTLRFGGKTAADALTPRVHVCAVARDATVSQLLEVAREYRFTRIPVFGEDLDDVVGVVEVTAAFALSPQSRSEVTVENLMVEALAVPETRDLVDLLADFRRHATQIAVVIDEHGGTAGIITMEDVLEEIVGEVDDEDEDSPELTSGVRPGVYLLPGTHHPDEVEEACGLVIPEGEYETIAGFLLATLGRIPNLGEHMTYDGWTLEVAEREGLRVATVRAVRPVRAQEPAEGTAEPERGRR